MSVPIAYRHIAKRIRQRAELFYGLHYWLAEDIETLQNALPLWPENANAWIDWPLPFGVTELQNYISLLQTVVAAGTQEPIFSTIKNLVVRPLSVIQKNILLSTAFDYPSDDDYPLMADVVRPRAKLLRMIYYQSKDDLQFVFGNNLLPESESDETPFEENITNPVTAGSARIILAFQAAFVDPSLNTDARASVIDAACGRPLNVE